jgi:hypothetical protein
MSELDVVVEEIPPSNDTLPSIRTNEDDHDNDDISRDPLNIDSNIQEEEEKTKNMNDTKSSNKRLLKTVDSALPATTLLDDGNTTTTNNNKNDDASIPKKCRPVKRARTAYFIFTDENRAEIQKKVPIDPYLIVSSLHVWLTCFLSFFCRVFFFPHTGYIASWRKCCGGGTSFRSNVVGYDQ